MSVITQQSFTQQFLSELSAISPKAVFMPFEKIASALHLLEEKGLPNNKWEEYKYCNVEAILRKEFKSLSSVENAIENTQLKHFINDPHAINIFIVNGKILRENHTSSLPAGLRIQALEELSEEGKIIFETHSGKINTENYDPFVALNTAYCGSGLLLHVKKNTAIEKPVHLIHVNSCKAQTVINSRKLIVLEEFAQLNFHESYFSLNNEGKVFENELSEIIISKNAILRHNILQAENENGFKVCTTQVHQEKQSYYNVNTFSFGGSMVRNNLNIAVHGEQAETHLNGLATGRLNQLIDNHTLVDHTVSDCMSSELYKGIANGKSTLVFNGKIFVRPDAQKINAYQSSKNILLSDDASINTKPQLEIFANDVKCSHGTSTGKVDEEALFYLKSRGIGDNAAKQLLLHAFASEVAEKVKNESFRMEVEKYLEKAIALNV